MDIKPNWYRRYDKAQAGIRLAGAAAQFGSQIAGMVGEAERVTQVNEGLAYYERAFQDYQQTLATRSFEVPTDSPDVEEIGGAPAADWSATVQRPLGQLTQADLDTDFAKFVKSQAEYVEKNFRNKAARRELLQHLQMGAIANRGKAIQSWQVASDHEALASFNNLYGVVMASDDSPEDKVGKISVRVDEMVRSGRMWKDTGEQIKAKATDTARYSYAYNGSMAVLKETGDQDQAEAWLNKNTPFYEGNPDARAKVFSAVQEQHALMKAKELERRRKITYSTDNEYLDKLIRGELTTSFVMGDDRSLAYDGQPYNLRDKYIGILEARTAAALKGDKPPGKEDGYLTSEVRLRYLDHNVTPEDYREWIRANTGYDADGRLKIHEELAVQFTDRADSKPLTPNISYGRVRLKEMFEKQASLADGRKDLVKADRYRKEYNQALSDFVRYIDNPDVARELLRKPDLIDQWVDNRVQKIVDDQVGEWLSKAVLRPESVRGGWLFAPLTPGERLQRTVQQGGITGREQEFAAQLGQYEQGIRQATLQDLGREADYRKQFPGGQLHLYYQAPEGANPKYLYHGDTVIFTYMEEGNELKLRVWNGSMERWETPPADLVSLWKPEARPKPTASVSGQPQRTAPADTGRATGPTEDQARNAQQRRQ